MVVRIRVPAATCFTLDRWSRVVAEQSRFMFTFGIGLALVVTVVLLALRPPSMWWWFR